MHSLGRTLSPLFRMLLVATVPFAAATAQQSGLISRTTLDNGLEVVVAENPAVPLATVLVAVRNGAFTQDSTEAGLAHLYEHLLFHSFRRDPSAFGYEVSRLSGRYNGTTNHEVVTYFVVVPSKHVEGGIKLLGRLLEDAHFSSGDLRTSGQSSSTSCNATNRIRRGCWSARWTGRCGASRGPEKTWEGTASRCGGSRRSSCSRPTLAIMCPTMPRSSSRGT